jgi:ABC-type transport system involved in multi-copper enzyme maturation permease subunit
MNKLRAWSMLVWISLRRLIWSSNTWMVLMPLAGCALYLVRRRYGTDGFSPQAFNQFSTFLMQVYVSIVLPLCTLAFSAGSIGGDREDRTLLFVLVRPLSRPAILLAKVVATLPLALGTSVGSFYLFCRLAGDVGRPAFADYLPAIVLMTLAYVGLFHLLAVWLRHSTIVALVYSLLIELLLGQAPGIIKRVAVNYYGRAMMFSTGQADGLKSPDPQWFEPFSPITARWTLVGITIGSLLIAAIIFQRREYRDLT